MESDQEAGMVKIQQKPVRLFPMPSRCAHEYRGGSDGHMCIHALGELEAGGNPAYGVNGAYIKTGDARGRNIHGGGSGLGHMHAFDPDQPLKPTFGCSRGHNQNVVDLGVAITQYQQNNPGMPITYCRK
jgi:hypothetical protein